MSTHPGRDVETNYTLHAVSLCMAVENNYRPVLRSPCQKRRRSWGWLMFDFDWASRLLP